MYMGPFFIEALDKSAYIRQDLTPEASYSLTSVAAHKRSLFAIFTSAPCCGLVFLVPDVRLPTLTLRMNSQYYGGNSRKLSGVDWSYLIKLTL